MNKKYLIFIFSLLFAGFSSCVSKKKFLEMGFDRVYPPRADLDQVIVDLKQDLEIND